MDQLFLSNPLMPVLGFRSWSLRDGRLFPINSDFQAWEPGLNKAVCQTLATCSKCPGANCHCGFNAYFEFYDFDINKTGSRPSVSGAIAGAGAVRIHPTGFRSEEAQILALYAGEDVPRDKRLQAELDEVSEYYGVEFFYEKETYLEFVRKYALDISQVKIDISDPELYRNSWQNVIWPLDSVDDEPSIEFNYGLHKTSKWYQNGVLHREVGPAVVDSRYGNEWWINGRLHREGDQPAIQRLDGHQEFWIDGVRHREGDRPAVDNKLVKEWYQNGELHRDNDRPAFIRFGGHQEWWQKGYRHREGDQPAIEMPDGSKHWYKHDLRNRDDDKPAIVRADGTLEWYLDGQLHREADRPAVIRPDGTLEWWREGEIWREADKPAVVRYLKIQEWYKDGVRHRESGPAVVREVGETKTTEYWSEGVQSDSKSIND